MVLPSVEVEHVFTLSIDLGGWYMFSTHLGFLHLARRSPTFTELATIHITVSH